MACDARQRRTVCHYCGGTGLCRLCGTTADAAALSARSGHARGVSVDFATDGFASKNTMGTSIKTGWNVYEYCRWEHGQSEIAQQLMKQGRVGSFAASRTRESRCGGDDDDRSLGCSGPDAIRFLPCGTRRRFRGSSSCGGFVCGGALGCCAEYKGCGVGGAFDLRTFEVGGRCALTPMCGKRIYCRTLRGHGIFPLALPGLRFACPRLFCSTPPERPTSRLSAGLKAMSWLKAEKQILRPADSQSRSLLIRDPGMRSSG